MRSSPVFLHRVPNLHAQNRVHAIDCGCKRCRHPEIPETEIAVRRRNTNHFTRDTFLGLALGMGLAALIDWMVGGPGVLSIFGVGL